MRLLADENFPKVIVESLRAHGHDVLWARTDCSGWNDTALLDLAESKARIILTLDKDFWQIAIQRRSNLKHSGVVLFRAHPATPANLEPLVHSKKRARRGPHTSVLSPATGSRCLPRGGISAGAVGFLLQEGFEVR